MLQISWKRLRRAVILAGLVNLILMPLPAEIKTCLTCGAPLIGRVDKKFCDDYCRSMYNNKANSLDRGTSFIRKVNAILRRNRRILEEVLASADNNRKVQKLKLLEKGFNFNYITGTHTNKQDAVYHFCYEYGYMLMENGWCYLGWRENILDNELKE